jgi:hypothetical protein
LLHRTIMADIGTYLRPNRAVAQMLRRMRANGKRTFLLTNSAFPFVDAGMKQITSLEPEFADGSGQDWRSLFDFVGVVASKPAFFTERRPFRCACPPACWGCWGRFLAWLGAPCRGSCVHGDPVTAAADTGAGGDHATGKI